MPGSPVEHVIRILLMILKMPEGSRKRLDVFYVSIPI